MRVRWKYNRFGHVEVWDESNQTPREADFYIQPEESVDAFFNHIGLDVHEVLIDEWDYAVVEDDYFGERYAPR